MEEYRNAFKIEKKPRKKPFEISRLRSEESMRMELNERDINVRCWIESNISANRQTENQIYSNLSTHIKIPNIA